MEHLKTDYRNGDNFFADDINSVASNVNGLQDIVEDIENDLAEIINNI